MFKVGQTISYGSQGVCEILEITEKEIGGRSLKYYVLKPVYRENNTIFVPVDNEQLTGKMRKVLSRKEIDELIRSMPDEKAEWIDDDARRREKYREILSSGDIKATVGVIKNLHNEQQRRKQVGKKLNQQDEILFNRAETLLYDELALVLDIKPEQVLPFIIEHIKIEEIE
ncbi:MAG: CarD family transcriptional regulator [Clostridia bacterium]|nr:CarD family transcriptional regulator [Clostridia bacterium]